MIATPKILRKRVPLANGISEGGRFVGKRLQSSWVWAAIGWTARGSDSVALTSGSLEDCGSGCLQLASGNKGREAAQSASVNSFMAHMYFAVSETMPEGFLG